MPTRTLSAIRSALRFSRSWGAPPSRVFEHEVRIPDPEGEGPLPGSLFLADDSADAEGAPRWGGSRTAPLGRGWVVLHGMSRLGRAHPELQRFARAVASTGGPVLVPEIREWRELEFAPVRAQGVLRSAVDWLDSNARVREGGVVLVGFSFGAPQALVAASGPEIARRMRGVVGWGGFADLERTFHFALLGEHDWEGRTYRMAPDPYVRWVIGSNCLPFSSRLDTDGRVARALRTLAVAAGERRIDPGTPSAAVLEDRLAADLVEADRELFELFASCGPPPEPSEARAVVDELIPLARREVPLLDPLPEIGPIDVPVRLLHPRSDRLIPFTESLRMARALESRVPDLEARITGLFDHGGRSAPAGPLRRVWENLRFLDALRSVFEIA